MQLHRRLQRFDLLKPVAPQYCSMSSKDSIGRLLSNSLDRNLGMHDNGCLRSSLHAGAHFALGIGALLKGDKSAAAKEFNRSKDQWDRVDNNKFGRTQGPGFRGDTAGRGLFSPSRSRSPASRSKK